jgi:hypothetical protein
MYFHRNHLTGTHRQDGHGWWRITWRVVIVATLGLALVTPHTVHVKRFHCGAGEFHA